MSDESLRILEAVVVRPGDTLILRVKPKATPAQAHAIRERALAFLPEGANVLVAAVDQVEVEPG